MKRYLLEDSSFFHEELKPRNFHEILEKVKSFIEHDHVILITSGGTNVPLEKVPIRKITNCSTGKRGALMCEYFLKKNKKVLFLYSQGSCFPFEHEIINETKVDNMIVVNGELVMQVKDKRKKQELIKNIQYYKKVQTKFLPILFHTVYEYGFLLTEICNVLNENMKKKYANVKDHVQKKLKFNPLSKMYMKNILNDILIYFTQLNNSSVDSRTLESKTQRLLLKIINFLEESQTSCFSKHTESTRKLCNWVYEIIKNTKEKKGRIEMIHKYKQNVLFQINVLVNQIQMHNKDSQNILLCRNDEEKVKNQNGTCYHTRVVVEHNENNVKLKSIEEIENTILNSHVVILCAATSDFYIPFEHMFESKIDSEKPLSLKLCLTPKFYKIINKYFCCLKLCMFKLENDEEMLLKKAKEKVHYADILIANTLLDRYNYVYIFKNENDFFLVKRNNIEPIENQICDFICNYLTSLESIKINFYE